MTTVRDGVREAREREREDLCCSPSDSSAASSLYGNGGENIEIVCKKDKM